MKYLKYFIIGLILIVSFPFVSRGYEFVNPKNEENVNQNRTSIYELYDLYKYLFPMDEEENTCDKPTSTVYAECKGVTVQGNGTYSLEDYVAGVMGPEFGSLTGNEEAAKAYAITIRTYTLHRTNNCTQTIQASSNDQNFNSDTNTYKKFVDATRGQVITDDKGIFAASYALSRRSDCQYTTGDGMCTIKRCHTWIDDGQLGSCKTGLSISVLPAEEISNWTAGTHWGGLEPYIASYLAIKKNYTTEQIIKHFFGDNVKISQLSGVDNSSNSDDNKKNNSTNNDVNNQNNNSDTTPEDDNDNKKKEVIIDTDKYKLKTDKLMVTTYTGAAEENGGFAGQISLTSVNNGKVADGMIAVRLLGGGKTWLPYKTVVYVETNKKGEGSFANGKFFYVADVGGLKQDEQIDVYCSECDKKGDTSLANRAPYGTYNGGKLYIVEKNVSWDKFLSKYYNKKVTVSNSETEDSENTCVVGDGSEKTNGEYASINGIKFPIKNYNLEGTANGLGKYFNLSAGNVSQCPWYAKHRAIEIVMTSNLKKDKKEKAKSVLNATLGNGNDWYAGVNKSLSYFQYSSDINKPKPGAIVSWEMNAHSYGHVGIIEKVYSDGSVLLSEGWNRFGADSSNGVSAIKIITRKMSKSQLQTYDGKGSFKGYTYLFSYKK